MPDSRSIQGAGAALPGPPAQRWGGGQWGGSDLGGGAAGCGSPWRVVTRTVFSVLANIILGDFPREQHMKFC